MAATNFTPISLYYSTTASTAPTAGNLVAGELAINTNDGVLYYKDSSGVVQSIASKAGNSGSFTNLAYTGTLTGGTGVVNLGSGQFYKDASGNVGIGNSSPIATSGTPALTIGGGGAQSPSLTFYSATNQGQISFAKGLTGTDPYDGYLLYSSSSRYMAFGTAATERMRIDSSGNLLVGTTAAISSGFTTISYNGTALNGLIISESAGTSGTTFLGFNNGSTNIGNVSRVGATSAVIYNTTSDQRLKSNIADANPVLDKLMTVKVRQFDWTVGDLHQDAGFIAQELEPVLSGIVTKGKTEEDMWQMDYSRLTPYLVKAIQEQQALIESLTTRLTALESK